MSCLESQKKSRSDVGLLLAVLVCCIAHNKVAACNAKCRKLFQVIHESQCALHHPHNTATNPRMHHDAENSSLTMASMRLCSLGAASRRRELSAQTRTLPSSQAAASVPGRLALTRSLRMTATLPLLLLLLLPLLLLVVVVVPLLLIPPRPFSIRASFACRTSTGLLDDFCNPYNAS